MTSMKIISDVEMASKYYVDYRNLSNLNTVFLAFSVYGGVSDVLIESFHCISEYMSFN